MASSSDLGYKKLFSNPEMLRQLLASFVSEPWVDEIDFSQSEPVEKSFVTEDYRKKEADLIWKINFRGQTIYIYLIIEFQSTVDHYMAFRILRYLCEFYGSILERRSSKDLPTHELEFPSVFCILLYNGNEPWTAPEDMRDLVKPLISLPYIPSFRYYKIAENEIAPEYLLKLKNLVGSLFLLETADSTGIKGYLDQIRKVLEDAGRPEVDIFKSWISHRFSGKGKRKNANFDIEEVMEMVEKIVVRRDKTTWQKGMEEGIEQGIEKGRDDSLRETARRLKKVGMDITFIEQMTDLSPEEIERL